MTIGRTVGQVAELSGVTVRTLHHYEQIGLLVPSRRSEADYRLYSDGDCDRLARILYYRELGFSLDEIGAMLDEPDLLAHLERQHALLREQMVRTRRMVSAIERELEAHRMNYNLTPEEKLEVFGDFDPAKYDDEAKERWGETNAWKESRRRASQYTKADWQRIKDEGAELTARMVAAMQAGEAPNSRVGMDLAEEHRQHITAHFYDCSTEIHRGLADLYQSDDRFRKNIDAADPGLTDWLSEASRANADRAES